MQDKSFHVLAKRLESKKELETFIASIKSQLNNEKFRDIILNPKLIKEIEANMNEKTSWLKSNNNVNKNHYKNQKEDLDNFINKKLVLAQQQMKAIEQIKNAKDSYDKLGLQRGCEVISVKKQFRTLAKILHPDKNFYPGSNEVFKSLMSAREDLLRKIS